jgi:hypothetical protein
MKNLPRHYLNLSIKEQQEEIDDQIDGELVPLELREAEQEFISEVERWDT